MQIYADKKSVLYIKRNTLNENIYLAINNINFDNEKIIWTANNVGGICSPIWVDENTILFVHYINESSHKIYKINKDGTGLKLLGEGGELKYNSAERRIYYFNYLNNRSICSMDLNGNNKKEIYNTAELVYSFLFITKNN